MPPPPRSRSPHRQGSAAKPSAPSSPRARSPHKQGGAVQPPPSASLAPPLRVAFLHPDLGLGGAERLVVDAASGLCRLGHSVSVYTSHYEPSRSFAETRSGAFPVLVYGAWLPRSIAGRLHIFFAMLRMLWLALCVALWQGSSYDVIIVDQVSACVPLLKLLCPWAKVLFYCHYPDQLLAPRASLLRTLYRAPFDLLEQVTTGLSDGVLVNSRFTLAAFLRTFPLLAAGGLRPRVLYPCIDTAPPPPPFPATLPRILLSINRYERKKEVATALRAYAAALRALPKAQQQHWHMVVAGGYDTRLAENVQHFEELCTLAGSLGLLGGGGLQPVPPGQPLPGGLLPGFAAAPGPLPYPQVLHAPALTLIRSFSDPQKAALLGAASALAYTPPCEHFGIVPLECMAAGRPVLCDASGGPLESVLQGATGWLCSGGQAGWDEAVGGLLRAEGGQLAAMGRAGVLHVRERFSREAFSLALQGQCRELVEGGGGGGGGAAAAAGWLRGLLWLLCAVAVGGGGVLAAAVAARVAAALPGA